MTLACSGLGFLLLSPLLRLIQTPSELKTFVSVYLTIILASLPAAFLYNLYGALLRAIGRANAALMALAAAGRQRGEVQRHGGQRTAGGRGSRAVAAGRAPSISWSFAFGDLSCASPPS